MNEEVKIYRCFSCGEALTETFRFGKVKCKYCSTINYEIKNNQVSKILLDARNELATYNFSKALDLYQLVLRDNDSPHIVKEALWGSLLSSLGVVYIRSYGEFNSIPTFGFYNKDQESIKNNRYYKELLKLDLDKEEKESYVSKVEELDKIYRMIGNQLELESKYDVFLCVKITTRTSKNQEANGYTKDSKVADEMYDYLTSKGLRVFYSERSLKGVEYDSQILNALIRSEKMIVISSSREYLETPWVLSEYRRWFNFIDSSLKDKSSLLFYFTEQFKLPLFLSERRVQVFRPETQMDLFNLLLENKENIVVNELSLLDEKIERLSKLEKSQMWLDLLNEVSKEYESCSLQKTMNLKNFNLYVEAKLEEKKVKEDVLLDNRITKLSLRKDHRSSKWKRELLLLNEEISKKDHPYLKNKSSFEMMYSSIKLSSEKIKSRIKYVLLLLAPIAVFTSVYALANALYLSPKQNYQEAFELLENGDYKEAQERFYKVSSSLYEKTSAATYNILCMVLDNFKEQDYYDGINYFNTDIGGDLKFYNIETNEEIDSSLLIDIILDDSYPDKKYLGNGYQEEGGQKIYSFKDFEFSLDEKKLDVYLQVEDNEESKYKISYSFECEGKDLSKELDLSQVKRNLPSTYTYGKVLDFDDYLGTFDLLKDYEFVGWEINEEEFYHLSLPYNNLYKDLDLKAKFEKRSYVISFKVDGNVIENIIAKEGDTILLPTLEKEGYTFKGWLNNETQFGSITTNSATFTEKEDLVLVPNFSLNSYYINLILDNGEIPGSNGIIDYTIENFINLKNKYTPKKDGYIFLGYKECDENGQIINDEFVDIFPSGNYGNKYYKAIYQEADYKIIYYIDNKVVREEDVVYHQKFDLYYPTKNGYSFGGWYTDYNYDQSNKYQKEEIYNYTEDLKLYAKYRPNSYEIVFVGATNPDLLNYSYYYTFGNNRKIENDWKKGYNFLGWYLDEECSLPLEQSILTDEIAWNCLDKIDNKIYLYPKFSPKEIKVSFVIFIDGEGWISISTKKVFYDEIIPFPTREEIIEAYPSLQENQSFYRWSVESFNSGIDYFIGDRLNGDKIPNDEQTTVFFVGSISYSIVYMVDEGIDISDNPTYYLPSSLSSLSIDNPKTEKEGYNFISWYVNEELTTTFEEWKTSALENNSYSALVLYPLYSPKNYYLTVEYSDGRQNYSGSRNFNDDLNLPLDMEFGYKVNKITLPDGTELDIEANPKYTYTENITLVVEIIPIEYSIEIEMQEDCFFTEGYSLPNSYNVENKKEIFQEFKDNIFRNHYTLADIGIKNNETGEIITSFNEIFADEQKMSEVGYDLTLLPSWNGNTTTYYFDYRTTYNISFDTLGGSEVSPICIKCFDYLDVEAPTKEGYEFAGWYFDSDYSEAFGWKNWDNNWVYLPLNFTLYAKWIAKEGEKFSNVIVNDYSANYPFVSIFGNDNKKVYYYAKNDGTIYLTLPDGSTKDDIVLKKNGVTYPLSYTDQTMSGVEYYYLWFDGNTFIEITTEEFIDVKGFISLNSNPNMFGQEKLIYGKNDNLSFTYGEQMCDLESSSYFYKFYSQELKDEYPVYIINGKEYTKDSICDFDEEIVVVEAKYIEYPFKVTVTGNSTDFTHNIPDSISIGSNFVFEKPVDNIDNKTFQYAKVICNYPGNQRSLTLLGGEVISWKFFRDTLLYDAWEIIGPIEIVIHFYL